MSTENKKKLEDMLASYEKVQNKKNEKIKKVQASLDDFVSKFEIFANSTIKPIMIEIGELLKEKGHDYSIKFEKEYKDDIGRTIDSRITMNVFPLGKGRENRSGVPAHIMFFADKYNGKVGIHENNIIPDDGGGTAGRKGEFYSIEKITTQIIEKEIIESIGSILRVK